jgi:CPA2 family monovalent cation:H+ antiporter-2
VARALERRNDPLAELPATVDVKTLTGHVVLVGYGRVGSRIAQAMSDRRIRYVVAEQNREAVERLRARGIHAVSGDAGDAEVLIQAHVARAALLVIATPDTVKVRRMAEVARTLNPRIGILLRTHSDEEAILLRRENLGQVFMGEHELALAMTRETLSRMGAPPAPGDDLDSLSVGALPHQRTASSPIDS